MVITCFIPCSHFYKNSISGILRLNAFTARLVKKYGDLYMNLRIKSMLVVMSLCVMSIAMPMDKPLVNSTTPSASACKTSYFSAFCQGAFAVGVFTATIGWFGYRKIIRLKAANERLQLSNTELEASSLQRQEELRSLKLQTSYSTKLARQETELDALKGQLNTSAQTIHDLKHSSIPSREHYAKLLAADQKNTKLCEENSQLKKLLQEHSVTQTKTRPEQEQPAAQQLSPPPAYCAQDSPQPEQAFPTIQPQQLGQPNDGSQESIWTLSPAGPRRVQYRANGVSIDAISGRDTIVVHGGLNSSGPIRIGGNRGGIEWW